MGGTLTEQRRVKEEGIRSVNFCYKGRTADINVFCLENLQAPADFQDPARFCTGFDYVLVGGQIAVKNDRWQNTGSGEVLKNSFIR